MTNILNILNPSMDYVRVHGRWLSLDGVPLTGKVRFTVPQRVVSVTDEVIFPAGSVFTVPLDATGAMEVNIPAVDDPDNSPTNWSVQVEEFFDGSRGAQYVIAPTMAMVADGLNLRKIAVPGGAVPQPTELRGAAGGLALLDADGDVVDAQGRKLAPASAVMALPTQQTAGRLVVIGSDGHSITFIDPPTPGFDAGQVA